MFKKYNLKCYNFRLMAYIVAATVLGLFVIESAAPSVFWKQFFGLLIGIAIAVFVSLIDYQFILKFYWVIYVLNILLLIAVKLWGKEVGGAKRWIELKEDSFSIQPSEFAKIFLILFIAKLIANYKEKLNTAKFLALMALAIAVPLVLIVTQPDLSTTLLIVIVLATVIYCAGLSYKIIGIILGVTVPVVTAFFIYIQNPDNKLFLLEPYQRERIMNFFNKDENEDKQRQQNYSVQAIGSGQLNGKGLNNDDPTSMLNAGYIYEPQTDFIFAVIGEELGFVGSLLAIGILVLIVIECILEAVRAKTFEARLICCGMAALITFQSFINIGVATRLLPNTGLPLPFYSYGLSSLVSLFGAFGIVLNIHLSRYEKIKKETIQFDFEIH